MQTGVLAGGIPFLRGGGGSREAVVLFGVNALLKRLDRTSNPARYTRQVERLLPGWRFTILGYAGGGFDEILAATARAIPTAPDLLLGISFGGMVALRLAASYPDRVRRLVLLSSAHRFSPRGEEISPVRWRRSNAAIRARWRARMDRCSEAGGGTGCSEPRSRSGAIA